jgi:hypothetical protein
MSEKIGHLSGAGLTLDQYLADYRKRYEKLRNASSWKFERQQSFAEPDDDSWQEFERGNWETSLERFNSRRPALLAQAREDAARGIGLYRVRIVAEPISPYLLWELNVLKVRGECGEKIRVVDAESIAEFERDGELPEILTLGGEVVYQILYDDSGALDGAIRSVDRTDVERWISFMKEQYGKGEEIGSFVARRVAGRRPSNVT